MTSRAPGAETEAKPTLTVVDGLAQLSFAVQNALSRRASEHDLSMIQTRLLGVLRDRTPGINELAILLDLDKSSVSGLVDRAERRGLVERIPSSTDRRAVRVGLTASGRSVVAKVESGFAADMAALLTPLAAAERHALAALIARLLA